MNFYNLPKDSRRKLVNKIYQLVETDIRKHETSHIERYASDPDTYIRKSTYQAFGHCFNKFDELRENVLKAIASLAVHPDEKVRQTAVNARGEIGKMAAEAITPLLESLLSDMHHSVQNAVIGALKQMGQKNPQPTLSFVSKFLNHPDPKIRREMIHGIELRGRTHPEDVLPLLQSVQHDTDKRVRKMLIHVIGQISYKKGCLERVLAHLHTWDNEDVVQRSLAEIVKVHQSYSKFSEKTVDDVVARIRYYFKLYP